MFPDHLSFKVKLDIYLNKLWNFQTPSMIHSKFGWNLPSAFGDEDENVKCENINKNLNYHEKPLAEQNAKQFRK